MRGPHPIRITSSLRSWPLHDAAASRAAEQAALAEAAPGALMARAGLSVARLALALAPHARSVQVWAGPGNNGGDGFVAARHLQAAGRQVQVLLFGDAARQPADAAAALRAAEAAGVPIRPGLPTDAAEADLLIDALLGLGARRSPEAVIGQAVSNLRRATAPVLAVDLPSGLHPDTGAPLGEAAVRATATLSLLTLKPGCFTHEGRDHAGSLWFDDLGVPAGPPTARLAGAPAPADWAHATHKGRRGDVLVVGGAAGMGGAAALAAAAASAAGAGRVYLSLLDQDAAPLPWRAELMTRPRAWQAEPAWLARLTVVCGCGGGQAVQQALAPLLARAGRLVLDADALNAVAADAMLRAGLQARGRRGAPTLITPHPLEAGRLLGCDTPTVQSDRLAAAQTLAGTLGCAVLLKGSGTVVASPEELPSINATGNAALATAGTGDVLAGWAGGRWAQAPAMSAARIGAEAAWQHGRAADLHVQRAPGTPLRATDLVEILAAGV